MTEREKLIEKVANIIWCDRARSIPKSMNDLAEEIINTIFDALKEPTDEMCFAGGEYVLSVGSIDCMHVDDRPEFGMKGRETGSYELFQAMLSASPLAPEGNINNDND